MFIFDRFSTYRFSALDFGQFSVSWWVRQKYSFWPIFGLTNFGLISISPFSPSFRPVFGSNHSLFRPIFAHLSVPCPLPPAPCYSHFRPSFPQFSGIPYPHFRPLFGPFSAISYLHFRPIFGPFSAAQPSLFSARFSKSRPVFGQLSADLWPIFDICRGGALHT